MTHDAGGCVLKLFGTIMIVFLFLSMTGIFFAMPAESQSPDILAPDFDISGAFDSTHTSDFYGMDISSPGVYLLTVNSTGGVPVMAIVSRYSQGSIYSISSCISNSSDSFRIIPSGMYLGAFYQLSVKINEPITEQAVSYHMSVEHIEPLTLTLSTPYLLSIDNRHDYHYVLNVDNGPKIYQLSATSYSSVYFTFYNSYGIQIASFYLYSSTQGTILLDSGTYHVFIYTYYGTTADFSFQLTNIEAPLFEPGLSAEINFSGPDSLNQYAILSIQEGMQYSMYLDPESNEDVQFNLRLNQYSGPNFNYWRSGETESVTDLTFWSDSVAYTDWDTSPNMTITRSNPVIYNNYKPTTIYPLSSVIVMFTSDTIGKAIFDYNEIGFVQTITPNLQITEHFDGIDGPFWKLYKMTGLSPSNLYEFNLIHDAAPNCVLAPYYYLYQPTKTNQYYLFYQRPLLSNEEQNYLDLLPDDYTYLSYDNTLSNTTVPYYHSQSGDRWLLVYIPDGYYDGDYSYDPLHSGDVHLEIIKVNPIAQQVDSSFSFNPAIKKAAIYTLQLKGGSMYQIEVSTTSLQIQGSLTLWNQTGHQLAYPQIYQHFSKPTSSFYLLEVECTGTHYLVVEASGDSPLTITVRTSSNDNAKSGISTLFFVGSIAAAATEGLLIGVVIGKIKFGKQPPG